MSQPSYNDIQPDATTQPAGSWRDWPPAAQNAIGCGGAAAITVLLLSLITWLLFAASLKMMDAIGGAGKPAAKAASPAQPAAPENRQPSPGNAR